MRSLLKLSWWAGRVRCAAYVFSCFLCAACGSAGKSAHESGAAGHSNLGGGAGGAKNSDSGGSAGAAVHAGGASAQGGNSAAGGATSAGTAGQGGEGGTPYPGTTYYVSPTGDDANPGTTSDSPVRTISHAATLARARDTLVLMDGTYDGSTPVEIPDGVAVSAMTPGQAVLVGSQGVGLRFLGSGSVTDLVLESFGTALEASTGTLDISGTKFSSCGAAPSVDARLYPIELSGSAKATLSAGSVSQYVETSAVGFAHLRDTAALTVQGGGITGVTDGGDLCASGVFRVEGNSELAFDGVTLADNADNAIWASDSAQVVFRNQSALVRSSGPSSLCTASVVLDGTSSLELSSSSITDSPSGAVYVASGSATLTLSSSRISGNEFGILADFGTALVLDARNSVIDTNADTGVDVRGAGRVTLDGTSIQQNGGDGVDLRFPSTAYVFRARNSKVRNNGMSGMYVSGNADSSFDLGSMADPGNNDFSDNDTSGSSGDTNLLVRTPESVTVLAVGNTWNPNEQGADGTGWYSASGAGAVLEVSDATAAGRNFQIAPGGAVVRLAENP